ncbi:O-acetyl-ADP-ribose deacetylase [Rubrobacter marinus]|uniref:O-acetyl-ADP-ribose deacetylase n=1 Tax=Rubrobacter marinus TaxID=2653852 RepID=A0A6G8PUR8_9ACTN|nr:O-acetyl-ADP-ribose deacetylase [Rubrobacter marinus]QIN77861.1 O-acetyl-ADP-ribose deacetylase [Rubrobacter marinus]
MNARHGLPRLRPRGLGHEGRVRGAVLELVQGDITDQETDAIVNAANARLAGGGGVDGAIHRAGGPRIMEECRRLGGCPTGEARITTGGELKARHVIHAVGPVYRGGASGEEHLLASAYRNSLRLAAEHGLESVAFPSLSTGAYGYPVQDAAEVALQAIVEFLENERHGLELVRFVLFDRRTMEAFEEAFERVLPRH